MVPASGLIAFPTGATARLAMVDYGHGTTASRDDVPSSFGMDGGLGIEGRWSAELFASAGFAVALPDYLSLGVSRLRPQYEVARTEASASLDLLRATQRLAAATGHRLNGQVFLTGFSQGAAAALAIARSLQAGTLPALRLMAVGAVSGPYELQAAELPAILDGRVSPAMASYLLGYVLTAWNPVYHLFAGPAVAFRAPYDARVESLFDGAHADQQIAAELPGDFRQLLTPRYLRELERPSARLLAALRANSTCNGWTPRVPVRLIADGPIGEIKTRVGTRTIRATLPSIPIDELAGLPGVRVADRHGDSVILTCRDADAAARALFIRYDDVRDVEISGARLEDAFLQLTSDPEPAEVSR